MYLLNLDLQINIFVKDCIKSVRKTFFNLEKQNKIDKTNDIKIKFVSKFSTFSQYFEMLR